MLVNVKWYIHCLCLCFLLASTLSQVSLLQSIRRHKNRNLKNLTGRQMWTDSKMILNIITINADIAEKFSLGQVDENCLSSFWNLWFLIADFWAQCEILLTCLVKLICQIIRVFFSGENSGKTLAKCSI